MKCAHKTFIIFLRLKLIIEVNNNERKINEMTNEYIAHVHCYIQTDLYYFSTLAWNSTPSGKNLAVKFPLETYFYDSMRKLNF